MTTDLAKPEHHLPRSSTDRRLKITGKLKTALDLMVWGDANAAPLDYDKAARNANLTVRAMRKALERPHVRAYLRQQRDVFRASISARVIFRMDELARQNDNRAAAVSACRGILQLEEGEAPRGQFLPTPGLLIVVGGVPHSPSVAPAIDVTPVRQADDKH